VYTVNQANARNMVVVITLLLTAHTCHRLTIPNQILCYLRVLCLVGDCDFVKISGHDITLYFCKQTEENTKQVIDILICARVTKLVIHIRTCTRGKKGTSSS